MITATERPTTEQMHRSLGQVLLALRESRILDGAYDLDYWRSVDGHVDVDWRRGAYATEVVTALLELADSPDHEVLTSADITTNQADNSSQCAVVWINGVRVRFRPYEPIGAERAVRERLAAAISEDLED